MSNHYHTIKKQFFINLKSNDASITPNGAKNAKFSWNISNINVSQRAQIAIVNFCCTVVAGQEIPVIIRCLQVKNQQYDSSGSFPLIYAQNDLTRPYEKTYYPISVRNLDSIDLYLSDSVLINNGGIHTDKSFLIQFEVIDYDDEEVDKKYMPNYTDKSLTFHYP